MVGTLALFWIVSGLVTLVQPAAAAEVLTSRGVPLMLAEALVVTGAIADAALGILALFRRWLPVAARGMIGLTLLYLLGGTILAPGLWADPLGPLVKAIPALVLALVALAVAEER